MPKSPTSGALKILHVAQTAQGGVGSYLEELVALQVQRHGTDSVRAVLPDEHAVCFPGLARAWLLPFRTSDTGRLGSTVRMAVQTMRAIRDWQPDIVHLHSTYAGLVIRPLLALMPGAPKVVYCSHGWAFDRNLGPFQTYAIAAIERVLARLCSAIVCVSMQDAIRAKAVGISPKRLKVVLNGIADISPLKREDGDSVWPKERLRILFVGRLDSQKGVDVLLSAMSTLGDSAFAIVVGSAVVADVKSALVPPGNVRIVGWMDRQNIAQLYASADLLVIPSRWEAFGLVALEAMRAGLPVVASRVGGLPEIVQDGITGRLVEPQDAHQLAATLTSMDDLQRAAMGVRGRQRFLQEFRIERVLEELERVYSTAIGVKRTTRFLMPSVECGPEQGSAVQVKSLRIEESTQECRNKFSEDRKLFAADKRDSENSPLPMIKSSPRRELKILHVAQTAQGGVGSYLEEVLSLQVQRHGAESVRVVLPEEHAAHFSGLDAAWLLPFSTGDMGRLGSSFRMAAQAMRAVRHWQPDIVHLHSTFAGLVMRPMLALLPGAPKIIYCAHGWAFADSKVGPWQAYSIATVERLLSGLCAAIVCVSRDDASRALDIGISSKRLTVVMNGIADIPPMARVQKEDIWPSERLRVLFVGRLDYVKGADVLFSAMDILGDAAFAVVVGSPVVADYRSALDPPDNVKVIGWVDRRDITQLYASADLLVIPSRNEACPLVALEAMRAGLPVVASLVGGLSEIVQDGITGRLVEPEDAHQLAAAVLSMDGSVRVAMGARGRQRFLQEFQIERVFEELELVYRTAMGHPRQDSRAYAPSTEDKVDQRPTARAEYISSDISIEG